MLRRFGLFLTAALVAVLCNGATAETAARQPNSVPTASEQGEAVQLAQVFRRYRDQSPRERRLQQFRDTPPRRDNDFYLRERREDNRDNDNRFRRDRRNSTEQERALDAVRRGDVMPLGGIIRSVQQFCPGTFLDATLRERGRSFAYRVTILRPNGRRVSLLVDAQNGTVLRGRCN